MNLRRIKACAQLETLYVLRDKRSLILAFILPLILLILYGSSLSFDVKNIPIAIWDQDRTPASRALVAAFEGSRYYHITGFPEGYRQIVKSLDTRDASVAMIIPNGYSTELAKGRHSAVQFLIDGTDSTTAGISSGYIAAIINEQNLKPLAKIHGTRIASLNPNLRVWFNPEMKSKNFIIPGLIGVILVLVGAILSSLTLAREWETGTIETMMSLPLKPMEIVIGKMLPYFIIGMINIAILLIASIYVFHVPFKGSLVLFLSFSAVFTVGTLGVGILISGVAKNQTLANQMVVITTFLPSFILSGFMFPIENMPRVIQAITYLIPARYLIYALKCIFLKGVGMANLYPDFILLSIFAVIVTFAATRKVPRRLL